MKKEEDGDADGRGGKEGEVYQARNELQTKRNKKTKRGGIIELQTVFHM
jgi:hypothetical protein